MFSKDAKAIFKNSLKASGLNYRAIASKIGTDHAALSRSSHGEGEPVFKLLLRWAIYSSTPLSELGLAVNDELFPVASIGDELRSYLKEDWDRLLPKKLFHSGYRLLVHESADIMRREDLAKQLGYRYRTGLEKNFNPNQLRKSELNAYKLAVTLSRKSWEAGFNLYIPSEKEEALKHHAMLESNFEKEWPCFQDGT